ncbi:hypothetical protein MY11210_000036 [Beauveria gryllotalpidicola]
MSGPHPIWPGFRRLLERYQRGTVQLADATNAAISLPDGLPFNGGVEELEGQAMEKQLKIQARYLLNMYDALVHESVELNTACIHIRRRLKKVELASHARLYAYRFDQVPFYWRQIYSDAQILTTFYALLKYQSKKSRSEQQQAFLETLDEVVARLDLCLITAGGGGRILDKSWIEETLIMIGEACQLTADFGPEREFSSAEPNGRPELLRPCARFEGWSIKQFETYMSQGYEMAQKRGDLGPVPAVFTGLIKDSWPAITDRKWLRPSYLFGKTLGGRRLVPVEIGRSYVDQAWGQELMSFREFVVRFIDPSLAVGHVTGAIADMAAAPRASAAQLGYLAQHNLFAQIPELRNDILVPDFCWADVPGHPFKPDQDKPKLDMPELNAWFGPANTTTPLHTDGYTNLLCQVVGTKYVRLYPPQADSFLRPMSTNENGVDMSNTSAIDIGAVYLDGMMGGNNDDDMMEKDDEDAQDAQDYIQDIKDSLKNVQYFECILEPGDALLIPVGWWHYVRSLSVSFSVSFWWN